MTVTIEPEETSVEIAPLKLSKPVVEPVVITKVKGKTTINIFLANDEDEMVINIMPKDFSGDEGFTDFITELEREVKEAETEAALEAAAKQ
jgi:hypothetical protein